MKTREKEELKFFRAGLKKIEIDWYFEARQRRFNEPSDIKKARKFFKKIAFFDGQNVTIQL